MGLMDGNYFRVATFERTNPKITPGSKWVRLETRIIDYTEDFRGVSDAAKLTFLCLLAAAPKVKNIFPNRIEALRELLGIETIALDELKDGEFIDIVDEQQTFDGFEPPVVAEIRKNQADIDVLLGKWNDMARTCGLVERTRIKHRGSVYKAIVSRFKNEEWVAKYPVALDAIPGLELLTKPGSIGTAKWRANFDWFVATNSVDMILNGKYGIPANDTGMHHDEDIGF